MGLEATVLIDIWALLLQRMAQVALPNWGMVGRWVMHLPRGKLFHKEIALALPVPRERQIGWVFHYFVGVVYGVFFAFLAGPDWIAAPTFPPAFIYALATIAGGWFLLHPGWVWDGPSPRSNIRIGSECWDCCRIVCLA